MNLLTTSALVLMAYPTFASVAVLTQHNDLSRSGANLNETILNTSNVNSRDFGLLYSLPVDDQIYAQPLIATDVNLGGKGTHNIVVVATVNDSVYAFDADKNSASAPYWHAKLVGANAAVPTSAQLAAGGTFSQHVGIVGTPVIDPSSSTLYVVARSVEQGTNFVQRLHALNLANGAERAGSPVTITATVPGTAPDSVAGIVSFNPLRQNQRAALALVNGVVYICWGSQLDQEPYHGWVLGYDEQSLAQVAVYNSTSNGREGSIWMSGAGPSADSSGNLYVTIANGPTDNTVTPTPDGNLVESFAKLTPNGGGLTVSSYFTAYNWQTLDQGDTDLGSSGLLLIPGSSLAFSGGKDGMVYLVNRDAMGGYNAAGNNVIQSFSIISIGVGELHGTPVWWDGPAASYAYVWPSYGYLQQYAFDPVAGEFALPAQAQSPTQAPAGQPGGILSLSANGSTAGTGILWASHQLVGDATSQTQPGILHAYDAEDVSQELWNSQQVSSRDAVGNFAKYVPPTVANGKVYLATFSNKLKVYGLLKSEGAAADTNWVETVDFHLTAWPAGATAALTVNNKTIIQSLSGVATNADGSPATFSTHAQLLREQSLDDTNDLTERFVIRDGSPAVDTDVTGFFQHSILISVSSPTASRLVEHNVESLAFSNGSALTFQVEGFASRTYSIQKQSGGWVLNAYSADVSGAGNGSALSTTPVVLHGTVSFGGGKAE